MPPDTGRSTIGVILPAYKAARHLPAAIAGLQAQDRPVDRIIVVEDGSPDETADVLRMLAAHDPRIDAVFQANAGAAAARNAALARADQDLILFHDADDRLEPEAVGLLAAALEADPALDLVFGGCRHVDADDRPTGVVARPAAARMDGATFYATNPIHTATGVMLRRRAVARAGLFDTGLRGYIDFDYWLRATAPDKPGIAALDAVLVAYRRHPGQITGDWRRMQANWQRIEKKHAALAATLGPAQRRGVRARQALFWSAVAYDTGDLAAARRLMLRCWGADPLYALRSGPAWMRSAACLASLLPGPLHDRLRHSWNRKHGAADHAARSRRRDSSR